MNIFSSITQIIYQEKSSTKDSTEARYDGSQKPEPEETIEKTNEEVENGQHGAREEKDTETEEVGDDAPINDDIEGSAIDDQEIKKDGEVKEGDSISDVKKLEDDSPNNVSERKSYPVILEAKPQHSGPALMKMVEDEKIKEENSTSNPSLGGEEMVVNGVLVPSDAPDGSATIVQYAVAPKMEDGAVQASYFQYTNHF